MKPLKIAQRNRPFSHRPGTKVLIPGTTESIVAYPAKGEKLTGPIKDFTIIQDLEKCEVRIFGHAKEGYFKRVHAGKKSAHIERLSLGSHKSQNIDKIKELADILPLWYHLGQITPAEPSTNREGTLTLLTRVEKADHLTVADRLKEAYLAGFESLLMPRLKDTDYWGIAPEPTSDISPLPLLTEGAKLIRALFFKREGNRLAILPKLAPAFHAGRFLGLYEEGIGHIDIEWSKKKMRRMFIHAESDELITLDLPKEIKRFRLGRKSVMGADAPITLKAGQTVQLDRFEK